MSLEGHGMRLKSRLLDIGDAIIAGTKDYSRFDRAITELKDQVADLKSRNGQLEMIVRQLRYLIIQHPQDMTTGLVQILQDADRRNITDQLRPAHIAIDYQPQTVIEDSQTLPHIRVKLPSTINGHLHNEANGMGSESLAENIGRSTINGHLHSEDNGMGSESLAENLERTSQLMKEMETNGARTATQKASPKFDSLTFISSANKIDNAKSSAKEHRHHKRAPAKEMVLSNNSDSLDSSIETLPTHKRASVMLKEVSTRHHFGPGQVQIVDQPTAAVRAEASQVSLAKKSPPVTLPLDILHNAADARTSATPVKARSVQGPIIVEAAVLPHLRVPLRPVVQGVRQPMKAMPAQAQIPAAEKAVAVKAAEGQALAAEKKSMTTSEQARLKLNDKPDPTPAVGPPILTSNLSIPTAYLQLSGTGVPAVSKTAPPPHMRVPPHLRILQENVSMHNEVAPAKRDEATSLETKADILQEKENIKIGNGPYEATAVSFMPILEADGGKENVNLDFDSFKDDPTTKQWLDALEVKSSQTSVATSTTSIDKLIDDFDDQAAVGGKTQRAPTPPGFTPITKKVAAVKPQPECTVAKNKKAMGAAFIDKAVSALPVLAKKYRRLDSPTKESYVESEYVAPAVNGTRILGSLLDAAIKAQVLKPNSRGDWYQPSMQWFPVIREGKRSFVLRAS